MVPKRHARRETLPVQIGQRGTMALPLHSLGNPKEPGQHRNVGKPNPNTTLGMDAKRAVAQACQATRGGFKLRKGVKRARGKRGGGLETPHQRRTFSICPIPDTKLETKRQSPITRNLFGKVTAGSELAVTAVDRQIHVHLKGRMSDACCC